MLDMSTKVFKVTEHHLYGHLAPFKRSRVISASCSTFNFESHRIPPGRSRNWVTNMIHLPLLQYMELLLIDELGLTPGRVLDTTRAGQLSEC